MSTEVLEFLKQIGATAAVSIIIGWYFIKRQDAKDEKAQARDDQKDLEHLTTVKTHSTEYKNVIEQITKAINDNTKAVCELPEKLKR